jgi:hypothetical protein
MSRRIIKKRKGFLIVSFVLILLLSGIYLIVAEESITVNVCCEKTNNGAWCQNTLEKNCDTGYRSTPTSCDATSFCKLGCCVDTSEGLCMQNTPEKVCEIASGSWEEDSNCAIPQCDLGCCILGDQASFVTLTRCKRLSSIYSLETNFKRNIETEASCILMAHYQDRGACVYDYEGDKTCRFTTRESCLNVQQKGNITSDSEFFKDYLCSADELATNCGPTTDTMCVPGKDEVYFKDSCGNPANIYDSGRIYDKDPSYWQKIVQKKESCGFGDSKGNANSKSCGNCEYFRGSICAEGEAIYGDHSCRDLDCYNTENGNDYKNGESWCVYQSEVGNGLDVVGSRHFRHVCINGEETIEPCADFRKEICIENVLETSSGDFREAACRVNRWIDCMDQEEEKDCLNTDRRDCYWKEGLSFVRAEEDDLSTSSVIGDSGSSPIPDTAVSGLISGGGACLPFVPSGLRFWQEGEAQTICSLGNTQCTVIYEKDAFGGMKCKDNCDCETENWVAKMNAVCTSLGDCGAYVNIAGKYTEEGVKWRVDGNKKELNQGLLGEIGKSGN